MDHIDFDIWDGNEKWEEDTEGERCLETATAAAAGVAAGERERRRSPLTSMGRPRDPFQNRFLPTPLTQLGKWPNAHWTAIKQIYNELMKT